MIQEKEARGLKTGRIGHNSPTLVDVGVPVSGMGEQLLKRERESKSNDMWAVRERGVERERERVSSGHRASAKNKRVYPTTLSLYPPELMVGLLRLRGQENV